MDVWEFRLQSFFSACISTQLDSMAYYASPETPKNGNTCLKDCSRSCQGPSRVWEAFLNGLWDERWTIGLEQARNAASYKFLFSCSILQVRIYSPSAVFILAPRTCEKKLPARERQIRHSKEFDREQHGALAKKGKLPKRQLSRSWAHGSN